MAWTKTAVLLSYKRPVTFEATCVATNKQNMMNVRFCHSGEFLRKVVIQASYQGASTPTPNIELKLLCHRASKYLWAPAIYKHVILRHWLLSEFMTSQQLRLNNVHARRRRASVVSRLRPGRRLVDRRNITVFACTNWLKPRNPLQDKQLDMCFQSRLNHNYRDSCLPYIPTFSTSKC